MTKAVVGTSLGIVGATAPWRSSVLERGRRAAGGWLGAVTLLACSNAPDSSVGMQQERDNESPSPEPSSAPSVQADDGPSTPEASTLGAEAGGEAPRLALRVRPGGAGAVAGNRNAEVCTTEEDARAEGSQDVVRRFAPDGQELWAQAFPIISRREVVALSSGDCGILGAFQGDLKAEGLDLVSVDTPPAKYGSAVDQDEQYGRGSPSKDGIVARLSEGGVRWAVGFSGPGWEEVRAALELDSGELLVVGSFVSEVHAGEHSLSVETGALEPRVFMALLTPEGSVRRLTQLPLADVRVMAAGADGSGVVAGYDDNAKRWSVLTFDSLGRPGEEILHWNGYSPTLTGLALDEQSNYYLAMSGQRQDTLLGETLSDDALLMLKLDAAGELLWLKTHPVHTVNPVVAVRGASLFVTGSYRDVADFGAGPMTATDSDVFLTEYDLDGAFEWALRLGGLDADYGRLLPTRQGWVGSLYLEHELALGPESTLIPWGPSIIWLDIPVE